MAKIAAKNINFSVNSVSLEDELNSLDQSVDQEVIEVDGFSSAGPERVVGNYDYNYSLGGNADFASGQGDATLFALIGSAGVATNFSPTGNSAGENDPHYNATSVVMSSYSISGSTGGAVTYSADLQGNSTLARAVS